MSANPLEDLARGWQLRGDQVPFALSLHARKRFGSRLQREGVEPREFRRQLHIMLSSAVITTTPPEWVRGAERADYWLTLGGGFACPLEWTGRELVVKTVLSAGTVSPAEREDRNRQRPRRPPRRGRGSRRAAPPPPPPPVDE